MLCDYCSYANDCTKIISKYCDDFKYTHSPNFWEVSCGETYYVIMHSRDTEDYFVAKSLVKEVRNTKTGERRAIVISIFDLQHEDKCFSSGIVLNPEGFRDTMYKTKEDAELIMKEMYINQ